MHNPLSLHMEAQEQEALSDDSRDELPAGLEDFVWLLEQKRPVSDIEAFLKKDKKDKKDSSSLNRLYEWEEKDAAGELSQCEYSYLHWAAEAGRLDAVEKLVEMGASVDITTTKTEQGITPLMRAARRGSLEVVEYLVGKGADVKAQDGEQSSVAHYAARNEDDDPRVLDCVIKHREQADAKDKFDLTILSVAAGDGLARIVAYILAKDWGKDLINIPDINQNTPLHVAVYRGYLGVVELLCKAGAKELPNKRGKRPFDLAKRYCPAVKRRILADRSSHE